MVKIKTIIEQLRVHCPFFFDPMQRRANVAGALSIEPLLLDANLPLPCAYVVMNDDEPDVQRSGQGYRQDVQEHFSVVVCLSAAADPRGQSVVDVVREVRADLFAVLLGAVFEDGDAPIEYTGTKLEHYDKDRAFYSINFTCRYSIQTEQTRQWADYAGDAVRHIEGMPDYIGANIRVNFLDPFNDVNQGGVVGVKPDTRIEHEFTVDVAKT